MLLLSKKYLLTIPYLPPNSITKLGANPTIASYNASVVKFYNAMGSLARLNFYLFIFFFEKRYSLLQRWRCSCKFKNRRIGCMELKQIWRDLYKTPPHAYIHGHGSNPLKPMHCLLMQNIKCKARHQSLIIHKSFALAAWSSGIVSNCHRGD
jgi:hypothetical protein